MPGPTVSDFQSLTISAGQTSSGVIVDPFGTLIVASGGVAISAGVTGFEDVSGIDSAGTVGYSNRAYSLVGGGGQILGETILEQASQKVEFGGYVSGTIVQGGTLNADLGIVTGASIASGATGSTGILYVESATVISTTVSAGGEIFLDTGGATTGTLLVGGSEIVNSATASNTTVRSGVETISSGGTAINTIVSSTLGSVVDNGTLAYAAAAGTTIQFAGSLSGGGLLVQSGPGTLALGGVNSAFSGTVLIAGGTLELTSGGALNAALPITFAPFAGATLRVDGPAGPANVINSLFAGDAVDLAGLAYTTGGTPTVAGNTVTIRQGAATETLTVNGAATDSFHLAADGHGGTLLTNSVAQIVVSSGQTVTISSGQAAYGVTVLPGGTLDVLSGGTVVSAVVSGTELLLGGTDSGGAILSGATLIVSSGGLASGTQISGSATVLEGGTTSGVTLTGTETVQGGRIVGTVLGISGGNTSQSYYASLTIQSGGSSFGSAVGTVVPNGATIVVSGGGVTTGTVVSYAYGSFSERVTGVASGSIVTGGEEVFAQGSAVSAILQSGGQQMILAGGVAIGTVGPAGSIITDFGTLAYAEAAGTVTTLSAALLGSGALVQSGPGTLVQAGPVSAVQYGYLQVFNGSAVISGGTLELGAALQTSEAVVFAPGATGTLRFDAQPTTGTVFGFVPGDAIDLASLPFSGTASSYSVLGNAIAVTEGSQSEYLTVMNAQANQFALAADGTGGTLLTEKPPAATVSSGQTLVVSSGVTSSFVTVLPGGTLIALSGGTVINANINGTELLSGGTDRGSTISAFGVQANYGPGQAVGDNVLAAGLQSVSGTGVDVGTIVQSGGTQSVAAGGLALSSTLASGGTLGVASGGLVSGAYGFGDTLVISPGATQALIPYFTNVVVSGGTLTGVTLPYQGSPSYIIEGATSPAGVTTTGSGVNLFVFTSQTITLSAGAVTTGTELYQSYVSAYYGYHGQVSYITTPGGRETVGTGALAINTQVDSGAIEILLGSALNTNVLSGGEVFDNGLLTYTEAAGSTRSVAGALGGIGVLVQSGTGTLVISGPTAPAPYDVSGFGGSVIISGGTLELTTPFAVGSGTIAFAPGASETLRVDVGSGGAAVSSPVTGFAPGDTIDLAGLAFTGIASPTVSGAAVTVTEGGVSETLSIAGAAGLTLQLATDGNGGTLLTTRGTPRAFTDYVNSGQTISGEILLPGDAAFVFAGGAAVGTQVAGGPLVVFGSATNTTISQGGNEFLKAGSNTGATVSSGGILWISGGVDLYTGVYGLEAVYSGLASAGTVFSGGGLTVVGGVESSFYVASGGNITVSGGAAFGNVVTEGGNMFLVAGTDSATNVNQGGLLTVSGGTDTGAQVAGTIAAVTHGTVLSATIGSGGTLFVGAGGTQSATTLLSGGSLDLQFLAYGPGGRVSFNSATDVLSVTEKGLTTSQSLAGTYAGQGFQLAADGTGGTLITVLAAGSVVHTPAYYNVGSGQTLAGATLSGGDVAFISAGGAANGTDVGSGGTLQIAGGNAQATTIDAGGNAFLLAGADVTATVNAGGSLTVSGGLDTSTVLRSGGLEFVTASGVASSTTVSSGGTLLLQAGGAQGGTVLLRGGALDLRDFTFASVSKFAFNSATDAVTFTAGGAAHSASLGGSYAGLTVTASADSGGGLLITAK